MGSNPWVLNASPLILLGKTGHLDLLATLADTVVVPQAVANEVGAKPDGAAILAKLTGNPAYRVAGRAKSTGRIAQAAPVVEHLRRTGLYVSYALVQHLLREVGE